MSDEKTAWSFRPGAAAFAGVRNEASVAYFFDEANRKAIRKTELGRLGSDASPRTIALLAKKKLFAEFYVTRGFSLQGLVALGPPPTEGELAGGVWNEPQTASLSLPSGQLRVETVNSFSLGPDLVEDDGLFIEVPPGEYTLTLIERTGGDDNLPLMVMTLTPETDTPPPPDSFTITTRPATRPDPPLAKYAAYTIENDVFTGWISPDSATINFDRKAAESLELGFGAPIRIIVDGTAADAYYLGDTDLSLLKRLAPTLLRNGDPLITQWTLWEELKRDPVLSLAKWSGKWHSWDITQWRSATIRRLPDPPLTIGPAEPEPWTTDGATLRARVLTCSPTVLTLSVGKDALAEIGVYHENPWDKVELRLDVGGKTHLLTLTGDIYSWSTARFGLYSESGDGARSMYRRMKKEYGIDTDDPDKFAAIVDPLIIRNLSLGPLLEEMRVYGPARALKRKPFPRPLTLFGATCPHWGIPRRDILWIEAAAYIRDGSIRDNQPAPHEIAVETGDEVRLMRA